MAFLEFSDLKKGIIIIFNNEPYEIIWSNFLRMQQRKPVMQVKIRNLIIGKVVEYSFKSGEKVESADIIKQQAQYLYTDQEGAHFMNNQTFETIIIPKALSNDKIGYLKEGESISILFWEERPISIELPIKVDLKVKSAPPGIRGDTATGGSKPATLETDLVVDVPLFVKEGDVIRVNTETGKYVERVN